MRGDLRNGQGRQELSSGTNTTIVRIETIVDIRDEDLEETGRIKTQKPTTTTIETYR